MFQENLVWMEFLAGKRAIVLYKRQFYNDNSSSNIFNSCLNSVYLLPNRAGSDGIPGKDGKDGIPGIDGRNGENGRDGMHILKLFVKIISSEIINNIVKICVLPFSRKSYFQRKIHAHKNIIIDEGRTRILHKNDAEALPNCKRMITKSYH